MLIQISKLKLKLLSIIEKLLFIKWNNPISRIIESIDLGRDEIIINKIKIRDACIVEYNYPSGFHPFFRRTRIFPDRKIYQLQNCSFIKETGIIVTNDSKIILESYGSLRKLLHWDSVLPFLNGKQEILTKNGRFYYLRYTGFYHFLLEEVTSLLYAIDNFDNLQIIINNRKYPNYFNELLNIVLNKKQLNGIIVMNNNITANSIVFTQRDPFSGGVHKNDILLLNKHVLSNIGSTKSHSNIYISRRKTPKRAIENEGLIEDTLRKHDFKIVHLQELSIIEQIQITQTADIIVGPHGAGLSHLIWNPTKPKKILEIFPSSIKNDCYANLAQSLDYHYTYLICDDINGNEFCDINLLENAIEKIL